MAARSTKIGLLSLLVCTVVLSACGTLGPQSIPRDRFDYSVAITDSWKRQMLLNIVKLRYAEPPVFMEVASIINQYEMASQVQAGVSLNGSIIGGDVYTLGGNARYVDRPTITYNPLTGQKFAQSLLTPLQPGSLFRLVQAGYPIDFIFTIGVRAINGVRNRSDVGLLKQAGDPAFGRLLAAMQNIQRAGAVGMRIKMHEGGADTVLFFPGEHPSPEIQQEIKLARNLLGLPVDNETDTWEYKLVPGLLPQDANEIAILSRSMLEILLELATDVDAPEAHVEEGSTPPNTVEPPEARLLRIHSQSDPPDNAFVAVPYRNHWYWVDNTDLLSKRAMTFLMVLFSLAETGEPAQVPVVTVGAGS